MGLFRSVDKTVYDQMMADHLHHARTHQAAALDTLLAATDNWTVR